MATVLETDPRVLFRHADLSIEPFVKLDLGIRLDHDSQLCPDFVSTGSCPKGALCPLRHVQPSPLNFQPPPPIPQNAHGRTVCKHWLRGLCKKGTTCEFMHEYHLRKMPECWFFAKYGFCSNGDEVSAQLVRVRVRDAC
jgi:cleavage and polyadenylation specificity factor subunit 4